MSASHETTRSTSGKPWETSKGAAGSADDPLATQFVQSLDVDRRLYKHDIAGSIAHARMLKHVGLIDAAQLKQIEQGLGAIEAQITEQGDAWPGWRVELEDVHMCIEAALIDQIGDAGRMLHTGRSRNDQIALDLKLWMADATAQLDKHFAAVFEGFVTLAERDGHIVMPAYTHWQRAQPILVGGEIIAWLTALDRAARRFAALAEINADNPLGSGAIAGSSLPLDRDATAKLLKLGGPSPSSIDATATRDAAVDFVYALAMTAMTLSRWAEQWIVYASTEFSFIELDERYTTGSSMMPQKRNPDMLELIRGRCGTAYGALVALMTICKGLPIGYMRDLQEDKRHLFSAYDTVADALAMAGRIAATTRFNADRIAASLDAGYLDATSLAEYLVTKGVAFRTAHQIVGSLVRTCREQRLTKLADLPLDAFNAACDAAGASATVCGADLFDWLGPANVVKRYRSAGNAGASGVQAQLAAWRKRLTSRS